MLVVTEISTLYCVVLRTVTRNVSLREAELRHLIGSEHTSAGLCLIVLVVHFLVVFCYIYYIPL